MNRHFALLMLLLWPSFAVAADWVPVTTELIQTEKPGYGKLCGVLVDPADGAVIVNLSDKGFYSSADQGKTWKKLNNAPIKGRTEWPGCMMRDPTGTSKTLAAALVYGAPISISRDGGENWKAMHNRSGHVDWLAVDWSDPETKFILALKHESGDLLIASNDGGQTFRDVGKGFGPAWIFDSSTAVVAETKTKDRPEPRLLRTTDAGKTFTPGPAYNTKALPQWHAGKLYWLVDGALIASADKGQTWDKIAAVKDGRFGPVFGKDAKHLFLLTNAGIIESTDAGTTWSKAIAVPKDLKGVSTLTWLAYDHRHDAIYVMKMTSELFRMNRTKE